MLRLEPTFWRWTEITAQCFFPRKFFETQDIGVVKHMFRSTKHITRGNTTSFYSSFLSFNRGAAILDDHVRQVAPRTVFGPCY